MFDRKRPFNHATTTASPPIPAARLSVDRLGALIGGKGWERFEAARAAYVDRFVHALPHDRLREVRPSQFHGATRHG